MERPHVIAKRPQEAPGLGLSTSTAIRRAENALPSFSVDAIEKAQATLIALMGAEAIVRGTAVDAEGRRIYVSVPDNPIRLAAAVKILEFGVGKPAQRVLAVDSAQDASARPAKEALLRTLAGNPELLERVFASLREAAAIQVGPAPDPQSGASPS